MKSKRAREAETVETTDAPMVNGADAPSKKRKRNDDTAVAAENGSATNGEVKKAKKDKSGDKKKKDKKDKKESRKEKKDKRKDLQDLPEEDVDDEAETKNETVSEEKKKKDEKKDKKSKKDKKDKKKQQKADESTTAVNGETTTAATAADAEPDSTPIDLPADDSTAAATEASGKQDRHIVFVGNLPFTATAASISAHFASLSPVAVRCLRDRDADEKKTCKGIAFVEFGKVWHMRTCLDKFHHSMFDDGKSAARKINVELTAGGGGKTKQRQQKIKAKNQKLDENRAKRIEKEKQTKAEGGGPAKKQQPQPPPQNDMDSIHPSRRGRVPGGY